MNIHDTSNTLIDLGAASVETQGPGGEKFDGRDYQQPLGLTND